MSSPTSGDGASAGDSSPQRGDAPIVSPSELTWPFTGPGVLLIGAGGMLGRAWSDLLTRLGIPHDAPTRHQLDLTRPQTIGPIVDRGYRFVVNCAAWTDVDGAEDQYESARRLNADGPTALASRCSLTGALLVHYSTDYVFNGGATRPSPADTPLDPTNAYGQTKAEGEQRVRASGARHLIIRTSGLYAPWGRNFVRTMVRLMRAKDALRVVNDQRCRVTSAEHLAQASWRLVHKDLEGCYHVAGGGDCSWHEFACEIASQLQITCRVEPCTTAEYPTRARRPAYSVLDLTQTQRLVGPMTPWPQQLADVLPRLEGDDVGQLGSV